jgi:hypothetical protein
VLGAMSLTHLSIAASAYLTPRGHSRSINPSSGIGGGGFVGAFELDVIGRYSIGHRTRSRGLSCTRFLQRLTFMHGDVLGLATLDFILWIILTRMMSMPLVIDGFCMHFDDLATHMAGLRVPTHMIADLESFHRHEPPIAV